jgi:hypothetical protein
MENFQHIVLTYSSDEYLPNFVANGHNLKKENIYKCSSMIVLDNSNNHTIQKKCDKFNALLMFSKTGFSHGFLYVNNNTNKVLNYRCFQYLLIEDCCYGNIGVVKLEKNPFESLIDWTSAF